MMMMMALATKAVATVGAGVSAVGGAVSAAGGAVAAGGKALSIARGAVTGLQAFSQFSAARAERNQLHRQALNEEFLGRQEAIEARNRVTSLNKEFLDTVGQQRIAFAANGIDLGSGSVRAARRNAADEADRQIGDVRSNSEIRQRQRTLRARSFRRDAKRAGRQGVFDVLTTGLNHAIGSATRKAKKKGP